MSVTLPASAANDTALARTLTARQDRLDVWALSYTFIAIIGALGALLLIASFQVVAAVLVQFTQHTRGRPLDEVSP